VTENQHRWFIFRTALVTALGLILSLITIYGVAYWKVLKLDAKLEEEAKSGKNTALYKELKTLSVLTAVLIEMYNKIMCGLTGGLAKHARSDSHTDQVIL